jgi:hypothetical protein
MTDTPMEDMDRPQQDREAESDDLLEEEGKDDGEDEGEREESLPDDE